VLVNIRPEATLAAGAHETACGNDGTLAGNLTPLRNLTKEVEYSHGVPKYLVVQGTELDQNRKPQQSQSVACNGFNPQWDDIKDKPQAQPKGLPALPQTSLLLMNQADVIPPVTQNYLQHLADAKMSDSSLMGTAYQQLARARGELVREVLAAQGQ
jgi:hypothetical protein